VEDLIPTADRPDRQIVERVCAYINLMVPIVLAERCWRADHVRERMLH
jgi:hypothetical protein